MNNSEIPKVDNIIYLGLPIGDDKFKEDFIKNNFKKCERAFYSLYGLGCTQSKNDSLSLQAILPIYFQIWT